MIWRMCGRLSARKWYRRSKSSAHGVRPSFSFSIMWRGAPMQRDRGSASAKSEEARRLFKADWSRLAAVWSPVSWHRFSYICILCGRQWPQRSNYFRSETIFISYASNPDCPILDRGYLQTVVIIVVSWLKLMLYLLSIYWLISQTRNDIWLNVGCSPTTVIDLTYPIFRFFGCCLLFNSRLKKLPTK